MRKLANQVTGRPWSYRSPRRPRVPLFQYVKTQRTQQIAYEYKLTIPSDFENTPSANRGKLPAGNNSFLPTSSAPSSGSKHFLWSLSFYAQFFDVDTNEVLRRCRAVAFPYSNFLDVLDGNPDLYGPFWIATTVVVILFLTGTISQYLAREGKTHFAYDFTLLSGAAGLIYGYTFVIPAALWGALKWFKAESANLLECVTLYGYANLVWYACMLAVLILGFGRVLTYMAFKDRCGSHLMVALLHYELGLLRRRLGLLDLLPRSKSVRGRAIYEPRKMLLTR